MSLVAAETIERFVRELTSSALAKETAVQKEEKRADPIASLLSSVDSQEKSRENGGS